MSNTDPISSDTLELISRCLKHLKVLEHDLTLVLHALQHLPDQGPAPGLRPTAPSLNDSPLDLPSDKIRSLPRSSSKKLGIARGSGLFNPLSTPLPIPRPSSVPPPPPKLRRRLCDPKEVILKDGSVKTYTSDRTSSYFTALGLAYSKYQDLYKDNQLLTWNSFRKEFGSRWRSASEDDRILWTSEPPTWIH